ncbi:hypothetical protein FOZ63_019975, partial [Perkinsus olseni]
SHRAVIIVTGVASVLALKVLLKLVQRAKVDLHALFGGPNRVSLIAFALHSILTWNLDYRAKLFCDLASGLSQFLPILGFVPKSLDHLCHALEIYADTVTRMDVVVVSEPELIRQVQDERPKTYIRSFNKHKIMPIPGMFNTEGEEWKRNRR